MAGKPTEPAPTTCSDSAVRANAPPGEGEGPVAVIRLRKADGRSLLLYSVDRERA